MGLTTWLDSITSGGDGPVGGTGVGSNPIQFGPDTSVDLGSPTNLIPTGLPAGLRRESDVDAILTLSPVDFQWFIASLDERQFYKLMTGYRSSELLRKYVRDVIVA